MRVTISHREEVNGLMRRGRDYFVDCAVEFSEEERAIIRARDLHYSFVIRSAAAPPSYSAYVGIGMLRLVSFVIIIGGLASMITQSSGGGFLLFAGIALAIFSWLYGYLQDRRINKTEQEVTLRSLLSGRVLTVYAFNPLYASAAEQQIRDELGHIKALIGVSTELQPARTFEL